MTVTIAEIPGKKLLSPDDLVALLPGVTRNTLAMWRYEGRGPSYYKLGKTVAYLPADVDRWLEESRHDSVRP